MLIPTASPKKEGPYTLLCRVLTDLSHIEDATDQSFPLFDERALLLLLVDHLRVEADQREVLLADCELQVFPQLFDEGFMPFEAVHN